MVLQQVQNKLFLKTGLTSAEVRQRLEKFGPNELVKKKEFVAFKIFLSQFKSPLIYVLVFAGLVTLFLRDFTDTTVIFAAVALNTVLGFYQEFKAQKSLQALKSLLSPKAKVFRDGKQKIIDARLLVPGDLVVLTIGDRVPADGVLAEATDLSVNEAILTGESMPVKKKNLELRIKNQEEILNSKFEIPDSNRAFMGTTIVTGIAKMIVTGTGMETEMGKIGRALEEVEEEKTPLQTQLGNLAKILALVVGVITVAIFVLGEIRGVPTLEMFTTSVAIAVAAIPEGLVVALTVILALGMQRILKRKAIVRKLLAAETLGSVSVICADKTGTLTEGKMQVVKADFVDQKLGQKAALLCNDMRDPLEVAMWEWAEKTLNPKTIQKQHPRLDEMPFSPQTKMIATLHPGLLLVSGAPEVVLNKCKIENLKFKIWEKKFEEYGRKGYRLVGFAYKKFPTSPAKGGIRGTGKIRDSDLKGLAWLGLLVYEDPVRKGVKEVLEECQRAGIKVKVVTGDYLPTALAVMESLGLDGRQHSLIGEELDKLNQKELDEIIGEIVLFARINPQQKLKIVQALKDNGEVVAMMGDGVNDAPALAKSDIGIVVGEASDVAKETADIVLLDSNFATIVHAVEEGRTIFENIKKVVLFLLSDSFTEIILIGGSILLGLPLPVTAAQILWVNLIEDSLPAIALAFEPQEKELMEEPPRAKHEPILDLELKVLIFIIGLSLNFFLLGLFYWLTRGWLHLNYIQTVMFVALGIDTIFISFACRSLRKPIFKYNPFANKILTGSVLAGLGLLLAAIYLPIFQVFLDTHPLGMGEWVLLLALGVISLLAVEGTKWLFIYGKINKFVSRKLEIKK